MKNSLIAIEFVQNQFVHFAQEINAHTSQHSSSDNGDDSNIVMSLLVIEGIMASLATNIIDGTGISAMGLPMHSLSPRPDRAWHTPPLPLAGFTRRAGQRG